VDAPRRENPKKRKGGELRALVGDSDDAASLLAQIGSGRAPRTDRQPSQRFGAGEGTDVPAPAQPMPPAEMGIDDEADADDEAAQADATSQAGEARKSARARGGVEVHDRAASDDQDEVEDEEDEGVDEAFLDEVVLVASAAKDAMEAGDRPCDRDPLCTRGFKHGGKGGKCSYKAKQ